MYGLKGSQLFLHLDLGSPLKTGFFLKKNILRIKKIAPVNKTLTH